MEIELVLSPVVKDFPNGVEAFQRKAELALAEVRLTILGDEPNALHFEEVTKGAAVCIDLHTIKSVSSCGDIGMVSDVYEP